MEYKNIYQKLLEIQKRITNLKKDAKGFGYDYLSGDKLLNHIKPMMNELGLILKSESFNAKYTRVDYVTKTGSKSEMHVSIDMKMTWIDTDTGEKDENLWVSNGQNDWDKGVGSAFTYGERYFLLKYFHIQTKDDVDAIKKDTSIPLNKAEIQILFDSKIDLLDLDTIERAKKVLQGNDKQSLFKLKSYLYTL